MPAPAKAVDQQVVWKNDEMLTFAISLVEHALALLHGGVNKFTTDVVPGADRGDGQGIAGSVVSMLTNASVIEPVGVFVAQVFYQERIKSERDESKGRWVNVHRLCSRAVAEEFLRRNNRPVTASQADLAISESSHSHHE
jgi:hypothetical protein